MKHKKSNVVTVGRVYEGMEFAARFAVGSMPKLSRHTRRGILGCLGNIGRRMESYGLVSIKEISSTDVCKYFDELCARGLSPTRIARHAAAMRRLCEMLGRPEIVPSNSELGCTRAVGARAERRPARRNKHEDQ